MILTDVDGVLLDWIKGFRRYLTANDIPFEKGPPKNWDLKTWVHPPHNAYALVEKFNASVGFAKLPAVEGARYYLNKLAKRHHVVAISCCGVDSHDMRAENLNQLFGPIFAEISCLKLGMDKSPFLSIYPAGSWWIEDNFEHAVAGAKLGHKTVLLDRHYNRHGSHPEVKRVRTWKQIAEIICQKTSA